MASETHIQWTDCTHNEWIGCSKVSRGCKHCYAEARDIRFEGGTHWGKGAPRRLTSQSNRNLPLKWNRQAADGWHSTQVLHGASRRPRVFCSSLSDWLDDEVDIAWFAGLLETVMTCQNLDWQMLTKRPQNFAPRMQAAEEYLLKVEKPEVARWVREWRLWNSPAHVWFGVSVENQEAADERLPILASIPAQIRFLSCEPLVGRVDLGLYGTVPKDICPNYTLYHNLIHWVIAGGESGPDCEPMLDEWVTWLAYQCGEANVAFFAKQMGGHPYKRGELIDFPAGARRRQFPVSHRNAV